MTHTGPAEAQGFTATGITVANTPDTATSWAVAVLTDNVTTECPEDVAASVVCYDPGVE